MKITCPECDFSRHVPNEKVPTSSVMVTCPQCQHRFKLVREHDNVSEKALEKYIESTYEEKTNSQNNVNKNVQIVADKYLDYQDKTTDEEQIPSSQNIDEEQEVDNTSSAMVNPWLEPQKYGYFYAFYQTTIRILFAASRFFAGLSMPSISKVSIIQSQALLFYCIVSLVQIIFERFWGGVLSASLAPHAADDPNLLFLVDMLKPKGSYFLIALTGMAVSIFELFLVSVFFTILFKFIAPKQGNFNILFQVVAYSSAPMLLCMVPMLGSVVGFIWSISTAIIGCKFALRLTWPQTLLGVLPVYCIGLYFILSIMFSFQPA